MASGSGKRFLITVLVMFVLIALVIAAVLYLNPDGGLSDFDYEGMD